MKHLLLASAMIAATAMAMPTVTWETLGNYVDPEGKPHYTQRITIDDTKGLKRLGFNMFARKMHAVDPADTIVTIVPGYYYIASTRFGNGPVTVDIVTDAALRHHSYMPDGFHGVDAQGKTFSVNVVRRKISDRPEQWTLPGSDYATNPADIYELNELLAAGTPPGATDVIPSVKSVTVIDGRSGQGEYAVSENVVEREVANENPEYYRLTITPDSTVIEYATQQALGWGRATLNQLVNTPQTMSYVIEDWPDFHYRGLMVDIARNYLPLNDLQKIVQYMCAYKLNTLHFHIVDDEAWRLEIPGLSELTDVGARRGYTLDENDFLAQIFTGNGDPNNPDGTSNGYLTRAEFIDFLRYCQSLGIQVIPEIESPGHARAAIRAMEARYRRTGDDTFRLIEDGDTSTYVSAQSFGDNVMNPALEGPYRFMDKVTTEIQKMYRDAGVPLEAIHIGGDEVAKGAWSGAPSVKRMMAEQGLQDQTAVHGVFVRLIAKMLADKGIGMNGWEEVALGHDEDFNNSVRPGVRGVNFWHVTKSTRAREAAAAGYPVVICNVDHFYLDQAYSWHPEERGLTWGGKVDELATLNGYPYEMGRLAPEDADKLIGISGQIFAETIRDLPQVQTYIFPKAFGLAERAWNSDTTYTDAAFSRLIGERELPRLARRGVAVHLRQPGIKVEGDKVLVNSPYGSADYQLRYTLDGTNPTDASPLYSGPIELDKMAERPSQVRASLFLGRSAQSVPTILFLE
ncbi:MAG: family 20 glycosylhydrolase [Muribaculaceae bacterium]|nr:family 20 glycosylhydrolase [Muribaculaceae bacterium]